MSALLSTPLAEGREPPGWYGKLSTAGDFVSRRFTPELIAFCDDWLSRAMTAGAEQLGERWLNVYLTAPLMRFAWAPGVYDAHWWFGVLMPSCDNVGRYFPLLVAQRRVRPPVDRIALDHLDLWFDDVARSAMHTLQDQTSIEAFEEALLDAPPWPTSGSASAFSASTDALGERYELRSGARLDQSLHALAAHELQVRFAGCSLWLRHGGDAQASSLRVSRGLPDAAAFAGLLAGL